MAPIQAFMNIFQNCFIHVTIIQLMNIFPICSADVVDHVIVQVFIFTTVSRVLFVTTDFFLRF